MLWKDGKKLDAFCDVIPVYLLVAGIAPLGAGIIIDVPQTLTNVGKYVALVGAVLTVLTSGRSSKNIIGKLGGGLHRVVDRLEPDCRRAYLLAEELARTPLWRSSTMCSSASCFRTRATE